MKKQERQEKIDALKKGVRLLRKFHITGLCYMVQSLYGIRVITYRQKKYLLSIIPKVLKNDKFYPFYWKMYTKAPRVRFLQEQIKKLEKK